MQAEIIIGPRVLADGSLAPARGDRTGAMVTADGHARYQEAVLRGNVFYAASQAATTWSVALAPTFTGIVVSNPVGSRVNLIMLQAGFALSVAPAAIAHIGFFGGYAQGGITAHTTPLTPASNIIGSPKGVALADGAATLVGTPVWLMPFMGGFTAAALPATSPNILEIGGIWIVPPGAYFGIAALTAVVGFGALTWEEVQI